MPIGDALKNLPQAPPPPTQWYTSNTRMAWELFQTVDVADLATTASPPGYRYTYLWKSATYDLHPELGGDIGPRFNIAPIFNKAARLFVQLISAGTGIGTQPLLATANLVVFSREFVNTITNQGQPGSGIQLQAQTNVSSKFTAISPSTTALAGFAPPGTSLGFGDGHPVRYWRVELLFFFFVETVIPLPPQVDNVPPELSLQAAVY